MMNKGIRGLFFIASAALLVACAAQNPTGTNASPALRGDAAIAAGSTVPTAGYRKVVKDGVEYFCTRQGYTGSRVDTPVQCFTQAQLAALQENGQEMLRRQQGHVGQVDPSANPGGAPYSAAQPLP
jgi:hypothetical protein